MRQNALACSLILLFGSGSVNGDDAVNRALADPPATGLLVTRVTEGTQAASAGLLPGDVIVAYAGAPVPDIPSMNVAMQGAAGKEEVSVRVVRTSGVPTFTLEPGRIGVNLIAIVKGEGRETLPAATGVSPDTACGRSTSTGSRSGTTRPTARESRRRPRCGALPRTRCRST